MKADFTTPIPGIARICGSTLSWNSRNIFRHSGECDPWLTNKTPVLSVRDAEASVPTLGSTEESGGSVDSDLLHPHRLRTTMASIDGAAAVTQANCRPLDICISHQIKDLRC